MYPTITDDVENYTVVSNGIGIANGYYLLVIMSGLRFEISNYPITAVSVMCSMLIIYQVSASPDILNRCDKISSHEKHNN